ncbi:conserved hypothetical protein [Talaromyces stipitatus ATCC 10500]|uniref:Uncharacterized protein n=1 Tax=Talaromyces stipitatus (strain ATCC 10500 / CBS 375.48 / QM 6759 / NRRL 1006) TaxID=441959 RepID=B8MA18_TALSN|nr:uncharacterized protein TSTA_120910 [Talaromyces stipitatus ATCC 10500]EED18347.1 conserved hypothetical protein [Talaromyces stipitatus ATCC 10500]
MSDPPAKRRRTSPTTTDATTAQDANNTAAPSLRSSVTHRQSFQSPTRSSLARSNPEVLSHVLARSPTRSPQRQQQSSTQGIPFGLRDRKALRPSLTANTESSPLKALSQSPRRGGAIAAAQQQAFAAPPRRISRRLESPRRSSGRESETYVNQGGEGGEGGEGEEGPSQNTPIRQTDLDEQLASELDSATRELEHSGLLAPSALNGDNPEPELPPTPTQLGREKRRKASQEWLSSPSAGRGLRKDLLGPSKLGVADVAPAEDIPKDEDEDLDPAVQERKKLKRELLAQLDELKKDVNLLEKWTNRAQRGYDGKRPDQEDVSNLISILASTNRSTELSETSAVDHPPISTLISSLLPFSAKAVPVRPRSTSPEPVNAFALDKIPDPKPYITAFAPLTLEHSTSLSVSTDTESTITETHQITLSAPPPFPSNNFTIPLEFTTDLQSQRITSISLSKRASAKIPPSLQIWIESRISDPILGLDISGLCVGITRFWEASVSRARIWSRLRQSQESILSKTGKRKKLSDIDSEPLTGPLKKSDSRFILPHLQRSSMLFSSPLPHTSATSQTRHPKLILSCPLSLDRWTSEAQLKPDISVYISDLGESTRSKIEVELKRLFHSVLREEGSSKALTIGNEEREAQAIVKAVEGVIGVLFGVDVL